jgi:hypothetical protein
LKIVQFRKIVHTQNLFKLEICSNSKLFKLKIVQTQKLFKIENYSYFEFIQIQNCLKKQKTEITCQTSEPGKKTAKKIQKT